MIKRLSIILALGFVITISLLIVNLNNVVALDENTCLSCHSVPTLSKTDANGKKISLYVNEQAVNTAAHRFIDCTTCHPGNPHQPDKPLDKLSLAKKCGTCHQYEYKLHLASVHGQQLARGNPDVATCVDCHSFTGNPHNVIRVLEYNASSYKKNIAESCAKCHNNPQLMKNYGILEKVYESYMRSFHGKAIQLGTYESTQLETATCTNCHGTHEIKSTTDPNSPVTGLTTLAQTCDKCHPGAGIEFAKGFLGHKEASPSNIPAAHYAELFFGTLLVTVLLFGLFVVIAALIRFTLNKWKEES